MNVAQQTRFAHLWLPGYLRDRWARRRRPPIKRVWVLFADHYEPLWGGADRELGKARVAAWSKRWPEIAARHRDSTGRAAQYTFFYPTEQYRPELLEPLAAMTHAGIADVEVHIHHDGEGEQHFVDSISEFNQKLHDRHGLLRSKDGSLRFGFIHGDWALDNSGPNGRNCGLNNELTLLKRLGCYADFTFPSVPHTSQPRLVNTIYWAKDDPERAKSHDSGLPVVTGGQRTGDLLIVPGPLAINWAGGRLVPRIEVGELAEHNPVSRKRVELWLETAPNIGSDVFIKLFAHGAKERNAQALLERDLSQVLTELERLSESRQFSLRYTTAWEMRQAIDGINSGNVANESEVRPAAAQACQGRTS